VDFQRMPAGTWIVPEWSIRTPIVQVDVGRLDQRTRILGFQRTGGRVEEVFEAGGADLARSTTTGAIQGIVVDSVGLPIQGARVGVSGSNQTMRTDAQGRFRRLIQVFLGEKRITGIKVPVDTTTRVLTAVSAILPIFGFPGFEWDQISEVLIYPDRFDGEFQFGDARGQETLGMVGTGALNRLMILSKPDLIAGFRNAADKRNVGIHEFAHLVDKADGAIEVRDFLLSCRVMGRRVEETMLHVAVDHARSEGLAELRATYVPTKRNRPCLEFLERAGFDERRNDHVFVWRTERALPVPDAVECQGLPQGRAT